ncbi:hypothetical protein KZZ52_44610 [Dactylosporangium sp. AC04546]|uniref:hypothetical protein n=1 Tax=Dactylosporangium sp. AC04546 TaxID=2862460 RepID=UPI001EE0F20F|nr:hypothetical protein [Dactylosporangium sp. AC04546]WVK80999.1 hypothetical protein KZZ52_44610 [Dactylosporangium sp. AC04546]
MFMQAEAAMEPATTIALVTAAAILCAVVWFDRRLLADLADTPDRALRVFDRNTWALIIVLSFPIGPMLYLRFAKGPNRFS